MSLKIFSFVERFVTIMDNFPEVTQKSLIGRAYEVLNKPVGGITTDDDDRSVRQVMRAIVTTYGKVLDDDMKERLFYGLGIDTQYAVPYDCIPLEDAKETCGCGSINCGIKKVTLPRFASFAGNPAIFFFGTENVPFRYTKSRGEAITLAKSYPMAPAKPTYYISGKEAIVVLPGDYAEICQVSFMGIPETPVDVDDECFDIWSEEFPISEALWAKVKNILTGTDMAEMANGRQFKDLLNNASSGNEVAQTR